MRTIDVNKIQGGNFYGGFPYKVSWQFGGLKEPSRLIIEVVNKDGNYGTPILSFTDEVSMTIGSFKFQGYLISYELDSTVQEKILRLEYVDKSVIMDRWWVGLNGIHGDKKNNKTFQNMIIVGKQYHPCDENMDSSIEYTEVQPKIDACDPCPYLPPNKYDNACKPELKDMENFATYYTFSDLINQVKTKVPDLNIKYDATKIYMYKAQHIGPLRSVLDSWAQDLGLLYFWDPFTKELSFKNRSILVPHGLTYEDLKSNKQDVVDVKFKKTLEGTYSRGFIGSLRMPGEEKQYRCENETAEVLKPLTINDLYNLQDNTTPTNASDITDMEAIEISTALSYYSQDLRDSFLWFKYYNIKNHTDCEKYIVDTGSSSSSSSSSGSSSSSSKSSSSSSKQQSSSKSSLKRSPSNNQSKGGAKGNSYVGSSQQSINSQNFQKKPGSLWGSTSVGPQPKSDPLNLELFGFMKILDVYHPKGTRDKSKSNFYKCRRYMSKDQKKAAMGKNGTPDDPKYYFFVAESDEASYQMLTQIEQKRASEFLGIYYWRYFNTRVPGASNASTEVKVTGPPDDGGGQWFRANEASNNLALFKFDHTKDSLIGGFLKDSLSSGAQENDDKMATREATTYTANNRTPDDLLTKSIMIWNRTPKWVPEKDFADKWYQTLYAWHKDQIPAKFSNSDGRPEFLKKIYADARWNPNIRLYIVKELDDYKFSTKQVKHPKEQKHGNYLKNHENGDGSSFKENRGTWGLQNTTTVEITIPGMVISPPVQSFSKITDDIAQAYTVDGPNQSYTKGYRVWPECSSNFKKLLPKFEYTKGYDAENADKVQFVQYNAVEIAESNLSLFSDKCVPSADDIDEYVQDVGLLSKYSVTDEKDIINFRMAGVFPEEYHIENGLSSASVEISDKGSYTSYEFTDMYLEPPSQTALDQSFRNKRLDMRLSYLNNLISAGGIAEGSNYKSLQRTDEKIGKTMRSNLYGKF
jgi:hypothetical protein